MARLAQRLAVIVGIAASFFAYLYHVPNSDGVPEIGRIRLISATMKIVSSVGWVSETLRLAPAWYIQRSSGVVLRKLKGPEVNDDLQIEERRIEGVPVRIYTPNSVANQKTQLHPGIVFYHGGAFYMGSIDTHHAITRDLARRTGYVVISVDYRLAPEHPFPAGLDDCFAVTNYILQTDNAAKFRIDAKRVAIAGDSAGGNLAAVIGMRFTRHSSSENRPRAQVLIYPVVQFFDQMLPSYVQPGLQIFHFGRAGLVLELYLNKSISDDILVNNHTSLEQKKKFRPLVDWSLIPAKYRQGHEQPLTDEEPGNPTLIENARQALDPSISPLLVSNEELAELPPTFISTVEHDRLRDQGWIYAERLRASGVKVIHKHYDSTFHGSMTFLDRPFRLDIAHQMLDDLVNYFFSAL